jgi:hypothetical protein
VCFGLGERSYQPVHIVTLDYSRSEVSRGSSRGGEVEPSCEINNNEQLFTENKKQK